jgi:osmoprotectant transport system permease protein
VSYLIGHLGKVLTLAGQHIALTVTALAIALAIAVPLGVLVARRRRAYAPVMGVLSVLYTIPSISLLVLLIPLLGLGFWPTVAALVIYCQAILVRNVAAGINGVDPAVLEAARGMGLSQAQILRDVELPLALPVILAGVRIATLSIIAIATIAAFFNAGGLGALIREGISQDYGDKILAGVIAVALIAILCDQGLAALARASRRG